MTRFASGMYSRLLVVKRAGATGFSFAVPGTVLREAVADWVFWAMRPGRYPEAFAQSTPWPAVCLAASPGILG